MVRSINRLSIWLAIIVGCAWAQDELFFTSAPDEVAIVGTVFELTWQAPTDDPVTILLFGDRYRQPYNITDKAENGIYEWTPAYDIPFSYNYTLMLLQGILRASSEGFQVLNRMSESTTTSSALVTATAANPRNTTISGYVEATSGVCNEAPCSGPAETRPPVIVIQDSEAGSSSGGVRIGLGVGLSFGIVLFIACLIMLNRRYRQVKARQPNEEEPKEPSKAASELEADEPSVNGPGFSLRYTEIIRSTVSSTGMLFQQTTNSIRQFPLWPRIRTMASQQINRTKSTLRRRGRTELDSSEIVEADAGTAREKRKSRKSHRRSRSITAALSSSPNGEVDECGKPLPPLPLQLSPKPKVYELCGDHKRSDLSSRPSTALSTYKDVAMSPDPRSFSPSNSRCISPDTKQSESRCISPEDKGQDDARTEKVNIAEQHAVQAWVDARNTVLSELSPDRPASWPRRQPSVLLGHSQLSPVIPMSPLSPSFVERSGRGSGKQI